jgi:hypothetical protein
MQIRDLAPEAPEEREVCAQLLVEEFRDIAPDAWPIIGKARETVDECLRNGPVRVARVNGTIARSRGMKAFRGNARPRTPTVPTPDRANPVGVPRRH